MGYFDGIVNAAFKIDRNGDTVYYPWGVLGRGRVLKDPVVAAAAKFFLRRYYQFMMACAVVLSVFVVNGSVGLPIKIGAAVVYLVTCLGWFFIGSRKFTAGAEYSDERLSIRESQANTAANMGRRMLWGFLIISLLMIVGGVWMIMSGISKLIAVAGWTLLVLGAFCTVVYIRMLRLKNLTNRP